MGRRHPGVPQEGDHGGTVLGREGNEARFPEVAFVTKSPFAGDFSEKLREARGHPHIAGFDIKVKRTSATVSTARDIGIAWFDPVDGNSPQLVAMIGEHFVTKEANGWGRIGRDHVHMR